MREVFSSFGSLKISIFLFLLFAFFCAIATFIESAYSTPTAWAMVYGSAYFGFIQLVLGLNLACGILRYKMINRHKIPLLVFHFSFLFILVGAAMTRYLGYEGSLHIREQASNATVVSSKSYVKLAALQDRQIYTQNLGENIALLPFANDFNVRLSLNGETASLKYKNLLLDVEESFVEDTQSPPLLVLMINTPQEGANELVLGAGDSININGVNFAFLNDDAPKPFVKINEQMQLVSSVGLNFMAMGGGESATLKALSPANASEQRLYNINDINFVVKFASMNAKIEYKGKNRPQDESFFKWFASLIFGDERLNLSQNAVNALQMSLSYKGESKDLTVFEYANPTPIDVGGQLFFVSYSPISEDLPFELYLKDFVIDRYPGSNSPSSYASEVEVRDGDTSFDYRIFMNNVLDYKGYRFYQSSYDKDEKGTILSVNKDPGKIPTYVGYFLLFAGMFVSLLNPKSRFRTLARLVNQDALKPVIAAFVLSFFALSPNLQAFETNSNANSAVNSGINSSSAANSKENSGANSNSAVNSTKNSNLSENSSENSAKNSSTSENLATNSKENSNANSNSNENSNENSGSSEKSNQNSADNFHNLLNPAKMPFFSPTHSQKLATLIVQKQGGRMTPLDTLAGEILEKVHKSRTYQGQNASGVVFSMYFFPTKWAYEPLIIMPRNKAVNKEFAKILGLKGEGAKYISYADFFDESDNYKLQKYVENANRKNPNARGVFDKELIKLDERANIVNLVFSGDLIKIFPLQSGEAQLWISPAQLDEASARGFINADEGKQVAYLFGNYMNASILGLLENDFSKADELLGAIKEYQKAYGGDIVPSESKVSAEIFANEAEIFVKLTPVYLLAGLLLLCLVLFKMLRPSTNIATAFKIVYVLNLFAFLVHTAGLCLRAYLADHAPWSNAYESMIYIAWALGLSGIFFSRKSPIALSLTSILAGLVLWVAHLGEMDPQITNLVPVLNSYWLSIHVSVITASYGFLGLCTLLGIFVLVLLCFMKKGGKHNENIARNITEATRINEMAMILGLILLTIGNFLGAIWANESWGRYWSWDSKETWALISILIYAAVLHIRLVPSLATQYNFAVASMFAYWSIIMTYFGVNYFLVGMHSYAAGDAAKIPNSVFYAFILMLILAIISFFKRSWAKKL